MVAEEIVASLLRQRHRTHRAKLGCSAEHYGKLADIIGQSIYHW